MINTNFKEHFINSFLALFTVWHWFLNVGKTSVDSTKLVKRLLKQNKTSVDKSLQKTVSDINSGKIDIKFLICLVVKKKQKWNNKKEQVEEDERYFLCFYILKIFIQI